MRSAAADEMVESGMSDGRCDFCPRPGRLVHCYCDNGHTDVGVWVCPEKHEERLFDVESVDIACRQCDQQGSWVALHEEETVGPNPTVVPAPHRCRVARFKTFAWKITCEVPGCGYIRINGDWYMAMGDARHHHALCDTPVNVAALPPDDNIAREDTP